MRYNVRSSSFTRFYYSANRFVSRTYRFQLSPPDRRNSTINFASRKRERFSFHFDRPRSAADLSLFPLSPPRSLSLSSAKIYSLLSPIARRFRFPSRSSKGKNLFLPLDRVSRIDPLIFLAVQRRKEKNKRSRVGRISAFRADFSDSWGSFYSFSSRNLDYLSSIPEWLERSAERSRNSASM